MKKSNIIYGLSLGAIFTVVGFSCAKSSDEVAASERYLYVASGTCNSGQGITTFSGVTSSRLVSKVGLSSKNLDVVIDLGAEYSGGFLKPETTPQSLIDNGDSLLMLTENPVSTGTGDRAIWKVPKVSPFNMAVYSDDSNAFNTSATHVVRHMAKDAGDEIMFSESLGIERIGTNGTKIFRNAGSWVNSPVGACANSATLISGFSVMPAFTGAIAGKLIYAHQGATAVANKIGIVSTLGADSTGGCIAGQQISAVTHTADTGLSPAGARSVGANGASPTAIVYIPTPSGATTGKLLVSYAPTIAGSLDNSVALNNAIVMYDINETDANTATISNTATVLYENSPIIYGISAMAYDSTDSSLYVATASQPGIANQTTQSLGYKIEKFSLNLANAGVSPQLTLIRDTSVSPPRPFIERNSFTKCVTSMVVGN